MKFKFSRKIILNALNSRREFLQKAIIRPENSQKIKDSKELQSIEDKIKAIQVLIRLEGAK